MKVDYIGKKFNKLTVVSLNRKETKNTFYNCVCDCGNTTVVSGSNLGNIKSCGCENRKKRLSLDGRRFGKLVVEKFAYVKNRRTYFYCKCDCGNTTIVCSHSLVNGITKGCGCTHIAKQLYRKNIIGQRFGKLVVESCAGHAKWNCVCDCGNTATIDGYNLKTGNTTSCGCSHYPDTDISKLCEMFRRHKSTIAKVEHKLFGRYIQKPNSNEIDTLKEYFIEAENTNRSYFEKEVYDYVKSICDCEIIKNDKKTIAPKEIDIYIPSKNVAIECDGVYFHSSAKISSTTYHLNKTKACEEKGIRLIHIYDCEWEQKTEIWKSIIASALGIYKEKLFARNCKIVEVKDKNFIKDFFETNHYQGSVKTYSKAIGLEYNEEIVQICLFGQHHFGNTNETELYRMATKLNTQIVGGFSKIMKHCGYNEIVSYVSKDVFDGKGYINSGWEYIHTTRPTLSYTDTKQIYSRHTFKKQNCLKMFSNVTKDMTEREMCEKNGIYQIWDCGKDKLLFTNKT